MTEAAIVRGLRAAQALVWFVVDPVNCIEHFSRRFGRVVRVECGSAKPVLVLIGPGFNRDVLMATDRLRPTALWPVRAPMGTAQANLRQGLLNAHGPEHKIGRDAIMPYLERGPVAAYSDQVRRIALAEIGGWPVGERVDIYALFGTLAQRYSFEVLFGMSDAAQLREFGTCIAAYHAANWSRTAAFVQFDLPGMPYRRVLRRAEEMQALVFRLIAQARECPYHKNMGNALATKDADRVPLSPARVSGQMGSVALASYETTSTTLTWALVLLSQHPEVMAALASEISGAGPIETMSSEILAGLPLLDGVLKETMRVISPVPFLGFKTLRDCDVAGFDLPKGATVMISPHLTHRLPELYDQPDRFLPERWLSIRPSQYEYLPFSSGRRGCPGYLFAMANMRLALAVLLSRFNVELVDGARIDRAYAAVNVPRGAVPAVLSRRSGAPAIAKVPRRRGNVFDLFGPAVSVRG